MRRFLLLVLPIVAGCKNGSATAGATGTTASSSTGTGAGGSVAVSCAASPTAWSTIAMADTGRYAPGAFAMNGTTLLFAAGWDASKHGQKTAFTVDLSGNVAAAGSLSLARNFVSVSPIGTGYLFAGGFNDNLGSVTRTDVFDSASATFSQAGNLVESRELFTTTALPDGRVVAIGGLSAVGLVVRSSAEVFDPSSGQWTKVGNLIEARFGHAAIFVPKVGSVLVGGGKTTGPMGDVFRSSLEWFDPSTGQFTHAGDLMEARDRPQAELLPDGRVLFIAGANKTSQTLTSTEIFDPQSGAVSAGPTLTTRRMAHAATTLDDGSIVVAGGWSDATTPSESTATAERLDPKQMTWMPLPDLGEGRHDLALVTVGHCTVLALGGLHAKQGAPSTTPVAIERIDFSSP